MTATPSRPLHSQPETTVTAALGISEKATGATLARMAMAEARLPDHQS